MGDKLHPDSAYVMQDKIGLVIAKGLSVVVKEKPANPVDFFGKWLLHQSSIQKREKLEKSLEKKVEDLKKKDSIDEANQFKKKSEMMIKK